jgi:EPS-associated MarR family transcriptional regulator
VLSPNQKLAGFHQEIQFEVLRRLQRTPDVTQRALAKELGISLGSINFCFQALVEKGWVKMQNFRQSNDKLRYAYLLTPAGLAEKTKLTVLFLNRKIGEYETLQREIDGLRGEVDSICPESAPSADAAV